MEKRASILLFGVAGIPHQRVDVVPTAQCIRLVVQISGSIFDFEVEVGETFGPASLAPIELGRGHEIFESAVVGDDFEGSRDNGGHLFVVNRVVALRK